MPEVKESFGCHIIAYHSTHIIPALLLSPTPLYANQLVSSIPAKVNGKDYDEENPFISPRQPAREMNLSALTQCDDKSASYECFSCSSSGICTLASLSTDFHTFVCLLVLLVHASHNSAQIAVLQ